MSLLTSYRTSIGKITFILLTLPLESNNEKLQLKNCATQRFQKLQYPNCNTQKFKNFARILQAVLQKYEHFLQDSSKILGSFESNLQDSCEVLNRDCKMFSKSWIHFFYYLATGRDWWSWKWTLRKKSNTMSENHLKSIK